jgi:HPt (histidine-containing phosphotransfer) domain-containing protein
MGIRILHVEDSADDAELLLRRLRKVLPNFDYERVETEDELARCLERCAWDAVISDYAIGPFNGFVVVSAVRAKDPHVPCFLVSGSVSASVAEEAGRLGADGWFLKSDLDGFFPALLEALKRKTASPRGQAPPAAAARGAFDSRALAGLLEEERVRKLVSVESGEQLLRSLLELFVGDTPAQLARARAAAGRADHEAVHSIAHLLAGSAAGIGASEARRLADLVERAAASGACPPEALARLEEECERLCGELRKLLT